MFYKNMAGIVYYIELKCHNEILTRCYIVIYIMLREIYFNLKR